MTTIDPATLPAPPAEHESAPPVRARADMLAHLATRRSSKPFHLVAPGPNAAQLQALLTIGARVPDHGKLNPWRFIVLEGDARARAGAALVEGVSGDDPSFSATKGQFLRSPLVILVVSTAQPHAKIPEWEQMLSAGALCHNLLLTAEAMGFGAVWLSGPSAYDDAGKRVFKLAAHERVAGFVYVGTQSEPAPERARPNLSALVTFF
jgi:nitroreductase